MALLWTDGFDISNVRAYRQKYLIRNTGVVPSWVPGRLGGQAINMTHAGNIVFKEDLLTRYKLNPATTTAVCGAAFSIRGNAGEWDLFRFFLGAAFQGALVATIQADTNFVKFKVVDANRNLLEGETGEFPSANFGFHPAAAWYFIELKYTFSVGAGAFEVRINGVQEIVSTIAYNTDPNAIGAYDRVGSASPLEASGPGTEVYVDDFYILDTSGGLNNDFLAVDAGGVEVNDLLPDGSGALTQWLDPEGYNNNRTRAERLQDLDNFEGITIEDGVAERELLTLDNLTTINQQVLGVQLNLSGFRHQAESPVQIRGIYRQPSDGQIGVGSSVALGAYKESHRKVIFEDNPVDSTLFDLTEINDGQFGVEVA